MAIESVFACSFGDCMVPCVITFMVTLFILTIIHLIIYRQLVKLAKKRYGIEGFIQNPSYFGLLNSSYLQLTKK